MTKKFLIALGISMMSSLPFTQAAPVQINDNSVIVSMSPLDVGITINNNDKMGNPPPKPPTDSNNNDKMGNPPPKPPTDSNDKNDSKDGKKMNPPPQRPDSNNNDNNMGNPPPKPPTDSNDKNNKNYKDDNNKNQHKNK